MSEKDPRKETSVARVRAGELYDLRANAFYIGYSGSGKWEKGRFIPVNRRLVRVPEGRDIRWVVQHGRFAEVCLELHDIRFGRGSERRRVQQHEERSVGTGGDPVRPLV